MTVEVSKDPGLEGQKHQNAFQHRRSLAHSPSTYVRLAPSLEVAHLCALRTIVSAQLNISLCAASAASAVPPPLAGAPPSCGLG